MEIILILFNLNVKLFSSTFLINVFNYSKVNILIMIVEVFYLSPQRLALISKPARSKTRFITVAITSSIFSGFE